MDPVVIGLLGYLGIIGSIVGVTGQTVCQDDERLDLIGARAGLEAF